MNIKNIVIITTVFVITTLSVFADHIPESSKLGIQYQSRLSVIGDLNNWNPYLEVLGNLDSNLQPSYYSLLTGSYYRVHRNVKIGVFYLLQGGARHDDDWVALNPGWEWNETINRIENNLILDLTPRFIVPYVFNNNAISSLKIRYQYNFFNNHQTLLLKPGLSYFYMIDRKPVWNTSIAYSFYIPLNFSETYLYEHGPYFNFIYHVNKLIKLEARTNLHFKTWTTGEDSLALGDSYSVNENGLSIGLGIIFTP
ncbi:MAG: hypothetical protein KAH95_09845 [Spirochaetales bacterium]|nr:hypothetical protein [Spirochaetales bacterium]